MAVYSARQSSYSDGDTITAAHTNDEFNAILATFNVSTGHTHDGSTAGDGGPISNLFSNALVFGTNADTDIAITFNANSNDGVLTWMEDEDYFQFSDDILLATTEKLQFRDTAIYIHSSADGQLDLIADTEIQIAATTVDINGNVDVSGTLTVAGAVDFGDAALSNVGAVQLDSIAGDGDTNTSITFSGSDVITITAGGDAQFTFNNGSIVPSVDDDIDLGTSSLEFKNAFFDGTVTTDALVADTADINGGTVDGAIIGGSSAAAITGTAITGTSFVIGSADISEAELETIDGVTAGTVAASKAVVVDSNKDIGSFRNITLTGELDAGSLDISGNADIDGTLETDALSINGTAVTSTATELNLLDGVSGLVQADFTKLAAVDSTAAELNIVDGGTSATSTTVADADRVVLNDNGTMVQVAVTDLAAYFDDEITAMPNLVTTAATTVGALNSGSITSGFGTINNGSSAITTTGTVTYGSLSDGSITITAFVDEDNMSSNSATLVPTQQSVKAYVDTTVAATNEVVEDTSPQLGGTLDTNGNLIQFGDSGGATDDRLQFGASQDLQIYHDGSNSNITDVGTGKLVLRSDGTGVDINKGSAENIAKFIVDGAVELYYDNSKKFETTSSGIDVTGLVEFDSISGTGSVAITDIADEDDMSSNSATQLATQQSIKAYADTKATPGFAVAMAIAL